MKSVCLISDFIPKTIEEKREREGRRGRIL